MRTLRNISTGATLPVYQVDGNLQKLWSNTGRDKTARWCEKYPELREVHEDGKQFFIPVEGWEITPKRSKCATKPATKPKPQENNKPTPNMPARHEKFELILMNVKNDRMLGRFPFLYGPAGSGKSTIAAQVAEELELPFYSVSSLQQKYELEGFSDASGKLVETSFYKAFRYGGVFCFDEMTTSPAEVLVAFNTACAQLVYNFPVVGMIKAHPDFHIIAADNTNGCGQSDSYTARFAMDASTRDRFTFIQIDYSREHEIAMAGGDASLVSFAHLVRKALRAADISSHLCTPRALKFISNAIKAGMIQRDALFYGICGSWEVEEINTIAASLPDTNDWARIFKTFAK